MKCNQIIKLLEDLANPSYRESWDNIGLLVGNMDKEVHKVLLALDVSAAVVETAIALGVDLIISHHPIIFTPLKQVNSQSFISKKVIQLIQNDISCYAMHTNFDVAVMAEAVANKLGLENTTTLVTTVPEENKGFGKIGILSKGIPLFEYADAVKKIFKLPYIRVCGNENTIINRVAIIPGSGKSMISDAVYAQADLLITGDIDHHSAIDAIDQNLNIIDAGHLGTEQIFVDYMADYLRENFSKLSIETYKGDDPFRIL